MCRIKMNELNKKLAEWAGFRPQERISKYPPQAYLLPDGSKGYVPDFTQSLDACFKWLVPKVHYQINLKNIRDGWFCMLYNSKMKPPRIEATNKKPALALCLAIKELLKKEATNANS